MKCMTCGSEMAFMTSDLYCCNECMLISSSLKPDSMIYPSRLYVKIQTL